MSIEDLSKDLAKDLFEYLKPLKTSITEYDLEVGLWSYFVKNIVPFTYDREYILKRLNALGYAPTETQLTEQSHIPYHNTPLIPEVAATIDNPANLVESVADSNWVRGGQPSRELSKCDSHYHQ